MTSRLSRFIDWVDLAVLDIATVLRRLLRRPVATSRVPARSFRLREDQVHVAEISLETSDPFLARNAFQLAPERYCPLPLDAVFWELLPSSNGKWELALVRRDTLVDEPASATRPVYAVLDDGRIITLRSAQNGIARLRQLGSGLLAIALLLTSLYWALSSFEERLQREIEQADALRRDGIVQLRALQESQPTNPGTVTLSDLALWHERIGQADMGDWQAAGLRVEGENIVLRLVGPAVDNPAELEATLNAIAPVLGLRRAPDANWLDVYWSGIVP